MIAGLFAVLVGYFTSRPTDVGFVMAANTRELVIDWPCDTPLLWTIDAATIEFPDNFDAPAAQGGDIALELARAEIRLIEQDEDVAAIEIGPSRWQPPETAGSGELRFTVDGEATERVVPLTERVRVLIDRGGAERALAARGIFRLGGSISDHGVRSRLLLDGRIIGRDPPSFGGQRQTFLDESVEQGGIMLSHPDLEEAATQDDSGPTQDWQRWCSPDPGREPDYAVATLRLAAAEPGAEAWRVSLFRRADAVAVQTLGAAVGSDVPPVRFSVTRWAKWIASAWLQTGLVVLAAAFTLLSTFYGGRQAFPEPPREESRRQSSGRQALIRRLKRARRAQKRGDEA